VGLIIELTHSGFFYEGKNIIHKNVFTRSLKHLEKTQPKTQNSNIKIDREVSKPPPTTYLQPHL